MSSPASPDKEARRPADRTLPAGTAKDAKAAHEGTAPRKPEGGAETRPPITRETGSRETGPRNKKLERIALVAGAALLALGAAYGIGRAQTSDRIDAAEERAAKASEAAKRAEAELKREREASRRLAQRLEARRQLHLAIIAMEARNFGTAQKHAEDAGARLSASGAEGELEKLAEDVSGYRLVATEDIGAQRQKLLEMARRFDAIQPPP